MTDGRYPPVTEISGKRAFGVASEISFRVKAQYRQPPEVTIVFRHSRVLGDLGSGLSGHGSVADDAVNPGYSAFEIRWCDAGVGLGYPGGAPADFADALTWAADKIRAAVAELTPTPRQ
jgi:hypothetical protein